MCNGHNHGAGCSCGFGPPYLGPGKPIPKGGRGDHFRGVIRERKRENWAAVGAINKEKIEQSLGQLRLGARWRKAILERYSKADFPIASSVWEGYSEGRKRGAAQRMLRAVGLRQKIVEELEPIHLEIPLFRLQPPRTENSKVIYQERQIKERGWDISVKVPGFATGADLSMYLEGKGLVETSHKECKQIAFPVTIRRYRVDLFLGNLCIARNKLIAEAGNQKTGQIFSRTIIACKKFIPPSPQSEMIVEYDLSKDECGNSKFFLGWGEKMRRNAEVTIPIPGIPSGIQVSISIQSDIQLEFDLEPKIDYKLYPTPEGIGISWEVSREKAKGKNIRNDKGISQFKQRPKKLIYVKRHV